MATIAILGTLDSKGHEHKFVADIIKANGHTPLLIDVGSGDTPQVTPDITREEVARIAKIDLDTIIARQDRGECVTAMSQAAPVVLDHLYQQQKIDGVISLGGGGGTAIGTAGMRALPIGFPKLMVSTLASGNTAHYVGTKDITMMPSVVDVAGLNRISKKIFTNAANAISAMVTAKQDTADAKPIIVASMFGNTTDCINIAKEVLEDAGYEVLVFHATGIGGKTMEAIIESGMVAGVLDLTTTEWADEVLEATLSAGPTRMDAMTKMNIPAVVAPGCVDMANFGEPDTIPEKFKDRCFYYHNPQVTLMRTNTEECKAIGKVLATKSNANSAPTTIMLPLKAISIINAEGQPFYDKEADAALFNEIRDHATVEVLEFNEEINSPVFAKACAQKLLTLIEKD